MHFGVTSLVGAVGTQSASSLQKTSHTECPSRLTTPSYRLQTAQSAGPHSSSVLHREYAGSDPPPEQAPAEKQEDHHPLDWHTW